jgi:hypothetical protein
MSKNAVAGQEAISLGLILFFELVYTGQLWTARHEAAVHYKLKKRTGVICL